VAVRPLGAHIAAEMHADVGAGDVVVPRTVQAAYLHVLDRVGPDGHVCCLCPPHRNEARRGAQEKTFHHLHCYPPCCTSVGGFGLRDCGRSPYLPQPPGNPHSHRIPDGTTWGCPPPSHGHISP